MFSAFCMGPTVGGRGLCDIDRVLISVAKSVVQKLGSPCTTKILYVKLPALTQMF